MAIHYPQKITCNTCKNCSFSIKFIQVFEYSNWNLCCCFCCYCYWCFCVAVAMMHMQSKCLLCLWGGWRGVWFVGALGVINDNVLFYSLRVDCTRKSFKTLILSRTYICVYTYTYDVNERIWNDIVHVVVVVSTIVSTLLRIAKGLCSCCKCSSTIFLSTTIA